MQVAEAIAHAICFLFPLFLFHQQVMELEAILVEKQENLEAREVQEVPEAVNLVWTKENFRIIKDRKKLAERDNSCYLLLGSQVYSA